MASLGAPALIAASRIISPVFTQLFCACGWKPKIIAFLVFKASIALKITVEVGLVTGVTPAITPLGSAILTNCFSLSSSITPTVFSWRRLFQIFSLANMFLIVLSSTTPRPVSSTAIFARR